MNKKLLICACILFSFSLSARDYATAIGGRAGVGLGLTAQHFVTDSIALEGMLLSQDPDATLLQGWNDRSNGLFVGLLEFYPDMLSWFGVSVYFGGGFHGGVDVINSPGLAAGIDGVVGLQWETPVLPLVVGLDWLPRFEFVSGQAFVPETAALNIRLAF